MSTKSRTKTRSKKSSSAKGLIPRQEGDILYDPKYLPTVSPHVRNPRLRRRNQGMCSSFIRFLLVLLCFVLGFLASRVYDNLMESPDHSIKSDFRVLVSKSEGASSRYLRNIKNKLGKVRHVSHESSDDMQHEGAGTDSGNDSGNGGQELTQNESQIHTMETDPDQEIPKSYTQEPTYTVTKRGVTQLLDIKSPQRLKHELLLSSSEKQNIPFPDIEEQNQGTDVCGENDLRVYFSALAKEVICYLPKSCINIGTGTLSLLSSMESAMMLDTLKGCGVDGKNVHFITDFPSSAIVSDSVLLSQHVPRDHMPHFIQDFPSQLAAINLLFDESSHQEITATCIGYRKFRKAAGSENSVIPKNVHPAVFLDPKSRSSPTSPWIHRFLNLLPPKKSNLNLFENTKGISIPGVTDLQIKVPPSVNLLIDLEGELKDGPQIIYPDEASTNTLCFRAIMTTPLSPSFPRSIESGHIMFKMNGLEKAPPQEFPVHIAILDRDGEKLVSKVKSGRNIADVDKLIQVINETKAENNLELNVDLYYFEGASFEIQVAIMNRADILVAVHGAALANIIFMKKDSLLIELAPFGYAPDIFKNLASEFGLAYTRIISDPDIDRFEACILRWNPSDSPTFENATITMNNYRIHAKNFANRPWDMPQMPLQPAHFYLPCIRAQRLIANPYYISERIKKFVQHRIK